jgi:hypothetical protein
MRRAKNKQHARELRKRLIKRLDSADGNERAELDGAKLTFRQLAERYKAVRLIPPQYVGDRKVAELRSYKTPKLQLRQLVEHFGGARIIQQQDGQIEIGCWLRGVLVG